ncbi:MAG: hypothetical protein HY001_03800 [Candidatus Portnoybacteria bacterium]|nr:hypothetical protein [Candidatus Portnoybacteria bacterium]
MGNRIGDNYLNCEIRLAEAKRLLEIMKCAENGTELKAAFIGFLEITKMVFFPLKKYSQVLNGYTDWWELEKKQLENDLIAKFFWNQRNDVVKGANELIEIRSIAAQGGSAIIQGPLMLYEGQIFRRKNESGRYLPHEEISNLKLNWDFIQKPIDGDPLILCERYLNLLDQVMESFIQWFPTILME